MISESISSGKYVFTIGNNDTNPTKNYQAILDKFVENKFISRIKLDKEFDLNSSEKESYLLKK